jgi:hypothetical protein
MCFIWILSTKTWVESIRIGDLLNNTRGYISSEYGFGSNPSSLNQSPNNCGLEWPCHG